MKAGMPQPTWWQWCSIKIMIMIKITDDVKGDVNLMFKAQEILIKMLMKSMTNWPQCFVLLPAFPSFWRHLRPARTWLHVTHYLCFLLICKILKCRFVRYCQWQSAMRICKTLTCGWLQGTWTWSRRWRSSGSRSRSHDSQAQLHTTERGIKQYKNNIISININITVSCLQWRSCCSFLSSRRKPVRLPIHTWCTWWAACRCAPPKGRAVNCSYYSVILATKKPPSFSF